MTFSSGNKIQPAKSTSVQVAWQKINPSSTYLTVLTSAYQLQNHSSFKSPIFTYSRHIWSVFYTQFSSVCYILAGHVWLIGYSSFLSVHDFDTMIFLVWVSLTARVVFSATGKIHFHSNHSDTNIWHWWAPKIKDIDEEKEIIGRRESIRMPRGRKWAKDSNNCTELPLEKLTFI